MGQRTFRYNPNVGDWRADVRRAKQHVGVNDTDYPDALILALIHVESSGNPNAHRSGSQFHGLLQQGTDNAKGIGKPNSKYAYGDGLAAIIGFLRWMELKSVRKNHEYIPEYMALVWKGGGGTLRKYKRLLKQSPDAARQFLAGRWGGSPLVYLRYFQSALGVWQGFTNENIAPAIDDFSKATVPGKSLSDTHYGKERSVTKMTPFELASYVTPEELRKGIVAQIYYPNEWHIIQMASPDKEDSRKEKDSGQEKISSDLDDVLAEEEARNGVISLSDGRTDGSNIREESLVDQRRRYAQALVEAEFYRRRLASRSVPAITGPFNPYPVSGFPGLIMTPGRPILGYVNNVSHNINIAGASGNTAVTMVAPRYWDEGEIWYWYGGEQSQFPIMKNFPQWHNRLCVAVNNTDPVTFERGVLATDLDQFYQFYVGSDSIEYSSNNRGKVSPEKIKKAVKDRDPSDLEVKEETLEIKEYNKAIATLDSKGRFAPNTLAHRFYGNIEPYDVSEANISVEKQLDYVERYGVKERELLEGFLGNRFVRSPASGRLLMVGPTFGGDRVNALQNQLLEYITDLEKRSLGGGV